MPCSMLTDFELDHWSQRHAIRWLDVRLRAVHSNLGVDAFSSMHVARPPNHSSKSDVHVRFYIFTVCQRLVAFSLFKVCKIKKVDAWKVRWKCDNSTNQSTFIICQDKGEHNPDNSRTPSVSSTLSHEFKHTAHAYLDIFPQYHSASLRGETIPAGAYPAQVSLWPLQKYKTKEKSSWLKQLDLLCRRGWMPAIHNCLTVQTPWLSGSRTSRLAHALLALIQTTSVRTTSTCQVGQVWKVASGVREFRSGGTIFWHLEWLG